MQVQPRPLYNKLKALKNNGCKLDIKEVDYETMVQLWHKEICFDQMLAELFDTSKYLVQKRRNELGINIRAMAFAELITQYGL